MSKQIHNPTLDKDPLALNVPVGGTSDIQAPLAAEAIGLLRTVTLGQPNSAVQLDANGAVPSSFLDSSLIGSVVTLNYTDTVVKGSTNKFTITNYASDKTYVLGATHGKISRVNDIVTYVAPLVAVPDTITINNESFDLTVFTDFLLPPSILSPTKGASMVGKSIVVKSTDLKMKEGHEAFKLVASDAAPGDNYGNDVAYSADGNTIVVGSRLDDNVNGTDAGAAYIYKFDGTNWIETKLIASDGTANSWFGWSVSASSDGNVIYAGAYGDSNINGVDAGAAYIYKWNGTNWVETKLIASDGTAGDQFGFSMEVDLVGDTIAVGARYNDNVNGAFAGAVYVYKWDGTNWVETKLIASDGAAGDEFGRSVTISSDGGLVVVGSRLDDNINGVDAGAAYIYKFDGTNWIETKLIASDGTVGDSFGSSVSISDDVNTIVVGARYNDNINGVDAGAAYIYKFDGTNWIETKLIASDGTVGDSFGRRVVINSNGIIVGVTAVFDDEQGYRSGSVYIYQWNGVRWTESKLLASDGAPDAYLGHGISFNGDSSKCVVGARLADVNGKLDAGAAYAFDLVYHTQTQYQLSTDPNFVNIVQDLTVDGPISEYTLTSLSVSTEYYLRVRYVGGSQGFSGWSNVLHFTTDVEFIPNAELAKIIASDSSAGDRFGFSSTISLDNKTIVVSSDLDDNVNGIDAGAAYIYRFNDTNWVETKIIASDGAAGDKFGYPININPVGDTIIVGSRLNDNINGVDTGAIYVYKWNGASWIETKLIASDGAAGDQFSFSASISADGNTVVVGSYLNDNINGTNVGATYIYKFNGTNWIETKIIASDGAAGDKFGWNTSVSSDGLSVLISAVSGKNNIGDNTGAVYIYKFDGTSWIETKIIASDGAANDYFGTQTDMNADGSVLVIGADGDDNVNGVDAGSAYVYKFNGTNWIETKLIASDGAAGDYFGWPVNVDNTGTTIVVGARFVDIGGKNDVGAVYIYKFDGTNWIETKVTPSKQVDNKQFGLGMSLSNDASMMLVAALSDKDTVDNSGVLYVYGT